MEDQPPLSPRSEQRKKVEEEKRKKSLEEKIQQIEVLLHVLNNGISRHRRSKDPILRTTLLVDKLCSVVDVGLAYLTLNHPDIPEDLQNKMKESAGSIKEELDFLLDWISSPQYDPDHIYGQAFVTGAIKKFNENSSSEKL